MDRDCGGWVRGPAPAERGAASESPRAGAAEEGGAGAGRATRARGWTTVQSAPATSWPGWQGPRLMPQAPPGEPCEQQQLRPGWQGQLRAALLDAAARGASDASAGAAP